MIRLLLLEPDIKLANAIKKYFEASNKFIVELASTSQQAIQIADKNSPDVVVLEIAIPDQNGIAFLYEFRTYDDWLDIPIIIHSHLPSVLEQTSSSWQKLGVKRLLYKPQTTLENLRMAVMNEVNDEAQD